MKGKIDRHRFKNLRDYIHDILAYLSGALRHAVPVCRCLPLPPAKLLVISAVAAAGLLFFFMPPLPPVVADNTALPSVEVLPQEGKVGDEVYVRIINYQPSKQIIITFGSGTTIGAGTSVGTKTIVAAKTQTDTSGYAVADFLVDIFPAGRYIIMADDGVNKITTGFKLNPSIDLSNVVSGFVGDVVVIKGSGFAAKKLVYIGIDDQKLVTAESDDKGQFSDAKLTIPPVARGNHNIKVQDSENDVATAVFNVRQQISILPAAASVGDNVTIMGTGFQAVSDVIIAFDDRDVSIVQTGADGQFIATAKVPPCSDGVHKVKVDDRINKAFKEISIASSMIVSPNNGFIGQQVGLQGQGFRPGFPVTLTYDNVKLDGTSVLDVGSFTQNFKVPVSRSGPHTIVASDGINVQRVIFTVESTPPLAPTPTLPADGDRQTKDIHFEWEMVNDPSGVTYTIEIADDPRFSNVIMSQANVIANYIDITDDSKMLPGRDKPYYWRVKAVDRASNESAWSSVSSFYKGHTFLTVLTNMPDWVKWVLIILGLVLFGFMFFWIGHTIRRLRQFDDETVEDDAGYSAQGYSYSSGGNEWRQQ